MKPARSIWTLAAVAVALNGCATVAPATPTQAPDGTPAAYTNNQPDSSVCRGMNDQVLMADSTSRAILEDAYARRGLSAERCQQAATSSTGNAPPAGSEESTAKKVGTVIGAVALIGLVALAAAGASKGGRGASSMAQPVPLDYDWAWDQFSNELGQLVWACRGRQSGQFAHTDRCRYKIKADVTWPGWNLSR